MSSSLAGNNVFGSGEYSLEFSLGLLRLLFTGVCRNIRCFWFEIDTSRQTIKLPQIETGEYGVRKYARDEDGN